MSISVEHLTESQVKSKIKKKLKKRHWFILDTSIDREAPKQWRGVPDLICFRWGTTVLIEVKTEGGVISESQWEFRANIGPHINLNLVHMFIYRPDEIPQWMLEEGENQ